MVQKLIEKLKSGPQTSLVISALEPGFLALIIDGNGKYVIQQCLQCFSEEDCEVLPSFAIDSTISRKIGFVSTFVYSFNFICALSS